MHILWLLVACEPEMTEAGLVIPEQGEATACLAGDFEALGIDPRGAEVDVDLTGTVVTEYPVSSFDSDLTCPREPARMLELTDGDGLTWQLGYGIQAPWGDDETPMLDVKEGDTVSLLYRHRQDDSVGSGFVLTRDGLYLAVMEVGRGQTVLQGADIPDISASPGAVIAEELNDCGTLEYTEVWFWADGSEVLTPFDSVDLNLGGRAYTAWAVTAFNWSDLGCPDETDDLSWAFWR